MGPPAACFLCALLQPVEPPPADISLSTTGPSKMDYVIGCDIGSQSLKACWSRPRGPCGEASAAYPIEYPQPTWAQQSAALLAGGLAQRGRGALLARPVSSRHIAGPRTGCAGGWRCADRPARPALHPAIIWMDRRAVAQCEAAASQITREAVFHITGLNLDPSHVAPKIRWLADHQPRCFGRTAHLLLPGSYVAYALTGELGVDYSNASSTLLMDVRTRDLVAGDVRCLRDPHAPAAAHPPRHARPREPAA